jgi:hypothetical protein
MIFVTAILPKRLESTIRSLSCELPPSNATPCQREEFADFCSLAIDCGATGFYREDLPGCAA